jgi:DNA repair exonuclease SbcCD ATPase subunit
MSKKSGATSNEELTPAEQLAGEIIFAAMHTPEGTILDPLTDPETFQAATSKLQAARMCLENYLQRLEEKKAELKNIEIIDAGSNTTALEDRIKDRVILQEEIQELEALIAEVAQHLLPIAEAALEEIRKKIDESLQLAILKVREKYEAFLAKLFSEASDVIYSRAYGRPEARKLN